MYKIVVDNKTKIVRIIAENDDAIMIDGVFHFHGQPFPKDDVTIIEMDGMPLGVAPLKYCYDSTKPELGFYVNELYVKSHPAYMTFATLRENLKYATDLLIEHGIL